MTASLKYLSLRHGLRRATSLVRGRLGCFVRHISLQSGEILV